MESAARTAATRRLKFSEMPFPDMAAQLERGNVDASWLPSRSWPRPWRTRTTSSWATQPEGHSGPADHGRPSPAASTPHENPKVVADFNAALTEVLDAAESDSAGVASSVAGFLKIDEAAAQKISMEEFSGELRTEQLTKLGELMLKYGYVSKQPDLQGVLAN